MPTVLHVLPADAPLSCSGLEDWLAAGPGVSSLLVGEAGQFAGYEVLGPPQGASPLARFKPLAFLMPRESNPWTGLMRRQGIEVVHLHDLRHLVAIEPAASSLDIPVVLSWPRGADPASVPFGRLDQVLVPSVAQGDRLVAAGCPEALIEVAPVPVASKPLPVRRVPAKGQPLPWVSAALAVVTQSLALVLEAFLSYHQVSEVPATLTVMTTAHLASEAEGLIAELGLTGVARCLPTPDLAALREAFAQAHLGVFPLEPAEPDVDVGLTGPAWLAAGLGLPLVLGPEGAADGFRDQQEAMLAELEPGAIARRMHFLACRPYAWANLGSQAARYAVGRVDFAQACAVPARVYAEVLEEARV